MKLTYEDFERILNIGISLTTEKDRNHLLNLILENGMKITNCDASTLYLLENQTLVFKIMKTISQNISRGADGESIQGIPPVALTEQNVCAYSAIHREIVNIPDVYDDASFDFSGPKKYDAMTGYHTQSMLVIPLETNEGELLGVLQLLNAQNAQGEVIPFDVSYEIIIRSLGSLAAVTLMNLQYTEEIKRQLHSFVEAMATAIDERTPYNGSHTRKVAQYTLLLAEYSNRKYREGQCSRYFDEGTLEKLELAALLHDIGKMIVPLSIMNRATRLEEGLEVIRQRYRLLKSYYKIDCLEGRSSEQEYLEKIGELEEYFAFIEQINQAGFLNDENYQRVQQIAEQQYRTSEGEWIPYLTEQEREYLSIRKGTLTDEDRAKMEGHAAMTEKILSKVHFNRNYQQVPKWAASHHEFLNGSGYPKHLKGEELDIETQMITVADIYDALTARDRPYKEPLSKDVAFRILKDMSTEGKLNMQLVEWLERALEEEETR